MSTIWRTHTTFILVIGVVLVVIAVAVSYMASHFTPRHDVTIGSGVFSVRLADTDEKRLKGLSGTRSLAMNEGMLFVFDESATQGIWMKDMLIPIDILWLDEQQKVVHIVTNAPPEKGEEQTYYPNKPALYVIELAAGAVQQYGIKIGDTANFNLGEAQ